jgi:hypothetical protein
MRRTSMSEVPDEVSFLVTIRRRPGRSLKRDLGAIRRAIIAEGERRGANFRVGGVLRDGQEQPRVWWTERKDEPVADPENYIELKMTPPGRDSNEQFSFYASLLSLDKQWDGVPDPEVGTSVHEQVERATAEQQSEEKD